MKNQTKKGIIKILEMLKPGLKIYTILLELINAPLVKDVA